MLDLCVCTTVKLQFYNKASCSIFTLTLSTLVTLERKCRPTICCLSLESLIWVYTVSSGMSWPKGEVFGDNSRYPSIIINYSSLTILLGPVDQSIVSITSSLRVISLTFLADSIHNILIFFAEKMWVAFALQKLLTFFQQKNSAYLRITRCKF